MKNYLKKSLMPNEQIICQAKVSIATLIPGIVLFLFILSMSIGLDDKSSTAIGIVLALIIGLAVMIKPLFAIIFTELAITDKKVMGKIGFIRTEEMNSPLNKIQNVKVSNGFFGKIFNYGQVAITTTSGTYNFSYISKPNKFKNTLMAQIDNSENDKMDLNAQKIADAIKGIK